MLQENDYPISVRFDVQTGIFSPCQKEVQRRVSDLQKMFYDQKAVEEELAQGDKLIYEIRYYPFITSKSDMALGVTRIFPGKVGEEYHMTKGHIHERDDQPEIYYCVQGSGYLLLDTLQGEFRAEKWEAGVITHIPPMWAHRVVNTGKDLLVFVASYNIRAGHEYALVEKQGFAQLLVERNGQPTFLMREALV
jgi:glucose-6-phosphate isomerase, archaeal